MLDGYKVIYYKAKDSVRQTVDQKEQEGDNREKGRKIKGKSKKSVGKLIVFQKW